MLWNVSPEGLREQIPKEKLTFTSPSSEYTIFSFDLHKSFICITNFSTYYYPSTVDKRAY